MRLPTLTVTGSHLDIRNRAIPHTTVDSSELELWGDPTPTQAIRDLPYSFGFANNENESNSGSGSADANIHGLGNLSTLTLINGRRAGDQRAYELRSRRKLVSTQRDLCP